MPSMTTYLSKGFFLLPLWFIRRDFSQNFNWLTVNFPICSALTLAPGKSLGESLTCSCRLLARSPCCFEFTARAIKPRLHATSGFFWNRCIGKISKKYSNFLNCACIKVLYCVKGKKMIDIKIQGLVRSYCSCKNGERCILSCHGNRIFLCFL